MAVKHGKNLAHPINSVNLAAACKSIDISMDIDLPDATHAGDTAKESLDGMYGWGMDAAYDWDPAATENDATIFAMVAANSKVVDCTPGGGTESATNPKYTGTAMLKSYRISIPHDGMITSRASFQGNGAITRDVTP